MKACVFATSIRPHDSQPIVSATINSASPRIAQAPGAPLAFCLRIGMGQMRVGRPAFARLRLDNQLRVAGQTSSASQREPNRLRHRHVHPPGARSGHRLHVLIAKSRRRRPAFAQLPLDSQLRVITTLNGPSPWISPSA